jgi:hypothetical protein
MKTHPAAQDGLRSAPELLSTLTESRPQPFQIMAKPTGSRCNRIRLAGLNRIRPISQASFAR